MKSYLLRLLLSVIVLLMLLACSNEKAIHINDPLVREAPPHVKVLAAYMIIENHSFSQKILFSVSSSVFEEVEIHQTVTRDGMMRMEHQSQLIIAPKSQVVLKPGSYHLMLMGRKKPLIAGDKVDLVLKFVDGEEITILAPVRKPISPTRDH